MKYHRLASLGAALLGAAANVSASPLVVQEDAGQCPRGYTMSIKTIIVYPTTSATPSLSFATPSSSVVAVETKTPSPSTDNVIASVSSTPAPELPVPESTQPAVQTSSSSTESTVAVTVAPTTTSTSEETSTSTSTSTAEVVSNSSSSSSSSGSSGHNSGEATYYGGNISGGTCSFSGYTLPSSMFGAALSADRWDDAASCGACVSITGPIGNSIKAMVVDQCPSCQSNHLDLFENAFTELSALASGVIDVKWSYVSCDLDGPLTLKNKDGTSEYWFSMQVVNANEPVTTSRTYYNFFEKKSGFGTDTVDVRVTGKSGKSVVVKSVGCGSETEVKADSNF
ncbi:hypothetical protein NUU61_002198 [Penicillium alfredii]|uniref:Expansin-like EG45 domain-containing protein n=1 Tax=Penicillium alfredii TaxID=1506179 RepID=A0A9W9KGE4_9EURO|nr:uncharacterized protein NUU61_002198 [Penicillium alfredii]KAJ5104851.1 hypothetical protein NUU61_002198 [Penicillium alfredii]